jgi:hypothetical protein
VELSCICVTYHVCYSVDHEDILVRVGTDVRDKGGHLHEVSQIISHPHYDHNSTNYDSDIALLKVWLSLELFCKLCYNEGKW